MSRPSCVRCGRHGAVQVTSSAGDASVSDVWMCVGCAATYRAEFGDLTTAERVGYVLAGCGYSIAFRRGDDLWGYADGVRVAVTPGQIVRFHQHAMSQAWQATRAAVSA